MKDSEPRYGKVVDKDEEPDTVTRKKLSNGVVLSTAYPVEFVRASELLERKRAAVDDQAENSAGEK